jgi:hypothetical protein
VPLHVPKFAILLMEVAQNEPASWSRAGQIAFPRGLIEVCNFDLHRSRYTHAQPDMTALVVAPSSEGLRSACRWSVQNGVVLALDPRLRSRAYFLDLSPDRIAHCILAAAR